MGTMLGRNHGLGGGGGSLSCSPVGFPHGVFYNYMLDFSWEHAVHVRLPKL